MSNDLKEEKLQPIVIDFTDLKSKRLDESWLRMFGSNVKYLLKAMFGDWMPDVKIKGSTADVNSFIDAMKDEKTYMKSFRTHGLDDPRTWRSRYELDRSVRKFEDKTGLTWPFK